MEEKNPVIVPRNNWLLGSIRVVVLVGVVIAWNHVIRQFYTFYTYEQTFFKVKDCVIPNPVTTPCFYGAFGFLLALVIVWKFSMKPVTKKALTWFTLYLLAGSLFAWYNAGRDLINFYTPHTAGVIGCSGAVITNPFTTACFQGAVLFLLAFIFSAIWLLGSKKASPKL